MQVTGEQDAEAAARHILSRPGARTEWCIIKRGAEGALLASRSQEEFYRQQALKVGESGWLVGGLTDWRWVSQPMSCGTIFKEVASLRLGLIPC